MHRVVWGGSCGQRTKDSQVGGQSPETGLWVSREGEDKDGGTERGGQACPRSNISSDSFSRSIHGELRALPRMTSPCSADKEWLCLYDPSGHHVCQLKPILPHPSTRPSAGALVPEPYHRDV